MYFVIKVSLAAFSLSAFTDGSLLFRSIFPILLKSSCIFLTVSSKISFSGSSAASDFFPHLFSAALAILMASFISA